MALLTKIKLLERQFPLKNKFKAIGWNNLFIL